MRLNAPCVEGRVQNTSDIYDLYDLFIVQERRDGVEAVPPDTRTIRRQRKSFYITKTLRTEAILKKNHYNADTLLFFIFNKCNIEDLVDLSNKIRFYFFADFLWYFFPIGFILIR